MLRALASRLSPVREAPDFGLLFYAALASGAGTWLAFIALVVNVTDITDGDARWVSALLIAEFLPLAVAGFLIGPLVDRLSRRRILVAADLVRAIVFVLLPFAPSVLADRRARLRGRRRDELLPARGRTRDCRTSSRRADFPARTRCSSRPTT